MLQFAPLIFFWLQVRAKRHFKDDNPNAIWVEMAAIQQFEAAGTTGGEDREIIENGC